MQKSYTIYTKAITILYKNLDAIVQDYKNTDQKIIMFGSSLLCGMIIYYLEKKSLPVTAIIDNNKKRRGQMIYEKIVYTPEEYLLETRKNVVILIASSYEKEMKEQLQQLGYNNENIRTVISVNDVMNDYSHVDRRNLKKLNDWENRKCQLNILNQLKEICEANGLRYYLAYGTLLGAVRHKGYIPWDDDMDVFMPIDDMLKLEKLLKNDSRFRLLSQFNTEIYFGFGLAYMVDLNILSDINKFPIQLTTGHSIDVFPLFGMPEGIMYQEYMNQTLKLEKECLNNMQKKEHYAQAISDLNEWLLQCSYDSSQYVGNVLLTTFNQDIFEREIFGDGSDVIFEGQVYCAPARWNDFLKLMYGDYMIMPEENKRISSHYYRSYSIPVSSVEPFNNFL